MNSLRNERALSIWQVSYLYKNRKMKGLLLVFAVLLMGSSTYAQTAIQYRPELTFDSTTYNYGEILQNSDGSAEFLFTNTGEETLLISTIKSSCGCLVPTWSKEQILPGDKGVIKIRYNTKRLGPFNKSLTVYLELTDAPSTSIYTIMLTVTGRVRMYMEKE